MAKINFIELENFDSLKEHKRFDFGAKDILYGCKQQEQALVTDALILISEIFKFDKSLKAREMVDTWFDKQASKPELCTISLEFEIDVTDIKVKDISTRCDEVLTVSGTYRWNNKDYDRGETFDNFFKHKLPIQIGFDVHYTSSYYSNAYSPAASVFYTQDSKKAGGYTLVDFFVNFRIKSARMFIKLQNAGDNLVANHYFNTPGYPMPGMVFQFGINWRFFD